VCTLHPLPPSPQKFWETYSHRAPLHHLVFSVSYPFFFPPPPDESCFSRKVSVTVVHYCHRFPHAPEGICERRSPRSGGFNAGLRFFPFLSQLPKGFREFLPRLFFREISDFPKTLKPIKFPRHFLKSIAPTPPFFLLFPLLFFSAELSKIDLPLLLRLIGFFFFSFVSPLNHRVFGQTIGTVSLWSSCLFFISDLRFFSPPSPWLRLLLLCFHNSMTSPPSKTFVHSSN